MASPPTNRPKKPVLTVLVAVGLLTGLRAVQLAVCDLIPPEAPAAMTSSDASHVPPQRLVGRQGPSGKPPATQSANLPDDPELRAMLSAACPHALEFFEQDIHQRQEKPPTAQPEYRVAFLPGVQLPPAGPRLAQRSGDWLVPPDEWYVPEDVPQDVPQPEQGGEPEEGGEGETPAAEAAPAETDNREPAGATDPTAAPSAMPEEPAQPDVPSLPEQPAEANAPAEMGPASSETLEAGPRMQESPRPSEPARPEVAEEPEAAPEPEPASPTDFALPREPAPEPQPQAAPAAEPAPQPALMPEPQAEPRTPAPAPTPEPQPATAPEPAAQPEVPQADPVPEPKPEPAPATELTLDGPELMPYPERYESSAKPQTPPDPAPAAPEELPAGESPSGAPAPPAYPVTPYQPVPVEGERAPTAPAPATQRAVVSPHSQEAKQTTAGKSDKKLDSIQAHRDLFAKNCYPSARECGECHEKHYDEWKISSHAYAMVSPMFQKFEQKITALSQGTVGYFCYRCHSPVGTSMAIPRTTPIWDMPLVAREGVTCIACHRINERYTKANGERRVVPGDIHAPVYGSIGGSGVAEAIARKGHYKVKTSPEEKGAGQAIHLEGRYFDQLHEAEFCTSCHQVAVHPGIKLEVVWEQYRQSPACKKGVTCQDCHMGLKPGEPSGYEICSIAEVGGKSVDEKRKHANHIFYGPNYSISHPGVFPYSKDADRWKIYQWLKFNWRAGWGTDDFEDAVDDGRIVVQFPKEWEEADDRYDAREVLEDNLKALERKNEIRAKVMSHSLHITGPHFKHPPQRDQPLKLFYDVTNTNEGHNVLTASLGAQPQLWANVVLIGPDGRRLWESGYTDSDGDVCDIHSRDVRSGRVPFDSQLFNLQSMFLITGATGTDREMPLPVNVDIDQLPFLRPGAIPISTTNHPPFIRMESRSIAPLGTKRVYYKVPGHLLRQPGRYRMSFRMRNRIEPIWFMRFCDATDEMVRMMNEGILDVHPRSVEFWVR